MAHVTPQNWRTDSFDSDVLGLACAPPSPLVFQFSHLVCPSAGPACGLCRVLGSGRREVGATAWDRDFLGPREPVDTLTSYGGRVRGCVRQSHTENNLDRDRGRKGGHRGR